MKKVCIITTVHNPLDARIFYREALSLKNKYSVKLVAPADKAEEIDGIEILPVKKPANRLFRILFGYKAFNMARKTNADIYHFHDFEFLFWGWLLKVATKRPVIFDSHEFFGIALENRSWARPIFRPTLKRLVCLYEKTFIGRFDRIIVANPLQKKAYKRASVILNLPPVSSYKGPVTKKDYHKVIYVGSITKDRVVSKISKISSYLGRDYKVSLVGRVVDGGFDPGIKSFGFVPNDKLACTITDYGVGLVPFEDKEQYHLSIASKVFDYFAMGMVVIAPKFIKESFDGIDIDSNILFVEGSPESFSTKIKQIVGDSDSLKKMSEKNRKDFLNKYNWEAEEKKLFKIYKEVLGG